jgi:ubiquinone/menaquinone biosynthesis C-methylase UbiE
VGWYQDLMGVKLPAEGESISVRGRTLTMVGGILRAEETISKSQHQTSDAFSFKWAKRDTFEGEMVNHVRRWVIEKYGDLAREPWFYETSENPILLDAGCGAALSTLALFEGAFDRIHYLGVDVSDAVDVAKARFDERGIPAEFLQSDLNDLPLPDNSVDHIFSEGVLHHTDNTATAFARLVRHLKPGGRFMFYVYRRKGPIREFTDDYVRDKLQLMTPEKGWAAMMPLTKLGKVLGDLNIQVDIPESIDLLQIPGGRIDLQRLFYWHVFKAFYQPEMSLDEMNHLNFDWYAPKNAHRHTVEEIRGWCEDLSLAIEHELAEEAGITVIARKQMAA